MIDHICWEYQSNSKNMIYANFAYSILLFITKNESAVQGAPQC